MSGATKEGQEGEPREKKPRKARKVLIEVVTSGDGRRKSREIEQEIEGKGGLQRGGCVGGSNDHRV